MRRLKILFEIIIAQQYELKLNLRYQDLLRRQFLCLCLLSLLNVPGFQFVLDVNSCKLRCY